jgi:PIN domain nuclease of toxin-antitoxin system
MLDIRTEHVFAVTKLPLVDGHRDPFDHLLLAQAVAEGMTFVSQDPNTRHY